MIKYFWFHIFCVGAGIMASVSWLSYRLDVWEITVWLLPGARDLSLFQSFNTDSVPTQPSVQRAMGNLFLEVKPPEHYGQYSLHLMTRLRMLTAVPPHFHMPIWYLQGQLDLHLCQICVMPVLEVRSCFCLL
jgi:hypothetical protein